MLLRMLRGAGLLLALGAASSAHAQEARVMTFGPVANDRVEQANGTVERGSSDFTLYEMNQWKPVARPAPAAVPVAPSSPERAGPDAVEASMTRALIQMQGPAVLPVAVPSVHALPVGLSELCRAVEPRPMAGLSIKAIVARRLYWPIVRDAECRYGLPIGLMDSLVIAESRYQVGAISPVGAAGLAQLMPATARSLGVFNRFDPAANIDGGARYLRGLLDDFRSVPLAVAAYNAGPGAVRRRGRVPQNRETPAYVGRVLGYWQVHNTGAEPSISARGLAQILGFSTL